MHTLPAIGILLVAACAGDAARNADGTGGAWSPENGAVGEIAINAAITYQTIVGWEAHAHSGEGEVPQFPEYADRLLDMVAYDLGINRVRLRAWSGIENPVDYFQQWRSGAITYEQFRCPRWETINDNADPDSIDQRGFHFTQLDEMVEQVILPLRRRLAERGEELYVNLTYAAFHPDCSGRPYIHADAAEYAEFLLAVFLHLRDRYGLVPDGVNVILEPDNTDWTGRQIGEALVTAARVLETHGFRPEFIGPSISRLSNAPKYMDAMLRVPGVLNHLKELSYHRYGRNTDASLRAVAERAAEHGLRTAMLERTTGDYEALHADLKVANVSAWQQFAIAHTGDGRDGTVLFGVDPGAVPPLVFYAPRTKFLRQYFRYVRRGAVRIEATSSSRQYDPLAFVNVDEGYVVIVKAEAGGSLNLSGLPPGEYGIMYTTDAEFGVESPAVVLSAGEVLTASLPDRGVITIHAK